MSEELVKAAELCSWLRDHSSGAYRPSAEAADLIESLLFRVQPVTATLPAAPAPSDALISILEEISVTDLAYKQRDLATKALDILAAPAPTEQQDELPPLPDEFSLFNINGPNGHRIKGYTATQMQDHYRAGVAAGRGAAVRDYVSLNDAALAARPAPTEDEFAKMMSDANVTHIACMMGNMIYNLAQKKGHMLTAADCEMFNNLREQWDAARQAPVEAPKEPHNQAKAQQWDDQREAIGRALKGPAQ